MNDLNTKVTCVTCNHTHHETFCPNCGEHALTKRITLKTVISHFFSSVTTMDKGLLFNLKSLLLNPKPFVQSYLNGKRKGIFNPISFLLLSVTIYLIFESLFQFQTSSSDTQSHSELYETGRKMGKAVSGTIKSNFKFFWGLSILWLGIGSKLFFRKYNLAEHLSIASFVIGQITFLGALLLFFKIRLVTNPFIFMFMFYLLFRIYKEEDVLLSIVKVVFTMVFYFILLIIAMVSIGFLILSLQQ